MDIASEPVKRRVPLRSRVFVLMAAALTLAVLAALTLSVNLSRLRESFTWVQHTNQVLREISAVERALLEAESAERGYLLVGEESYLANYDRSRDEIPRLLIELRGLISDNPVQTRRLDELRTDIEARLDEFKQAIELGPARLTEALAILKTAQFTQLTPQIEEKLSELRQTELSLLEERQQEADRSAVLSTFSAIAFSIFALLSAAIGISLLEQQRTISRLRSTNEELMKSRDGLTSREAHLQAILATVPDAMVTIDESGSIQSFSQTAERLFGVTFQEVFGKNVSTLMPEPYRQEHDSYLTRYLATGEPRIIGKGRVVVGQRSDGSTFPMELAVGEVQIDGKRQFIGFIRDLTQRQERERLLQEVQSELLHVSRLSTMGEMASSLAHELNQPLAAVTNYLQGSRRLLENIPDERAGTARAALDKAAEQALRAGQVIRRLRDFIARGEIEPQIENIINLVEEAITLALVVAKEHSIQMKMQFDPSVSHVLVDKIQIQQVLVNLMRNAIEAMQNSVCRELAVSTHPAAGGMVVVTVSDTGSGIDPDVAGKLFQPFITTKRQGTGIGLSISRTIIEAHGGQISVEPNRGEGTTFRFTLRSVPSRERDGGD